MSQPVFVLIDGNPELLLSRGLSRLEIVLFAVLLAVVPPLLAVAYAWLAGRLSPWVGDVLYLVFLGAGLVPLATRLLKPVDAGLLLAAGLVAALAPSGSSPTGAGARRGSSSGTRSSSRSSACSGSSTACPR